MAILAKRSHLQRLVRDRRQWPTLAAGPDLRGGTGVLRSRLLCCHVEERRGGGGGVAGSLDASSSWVPVRGALMGRGLFGTPRPDRFPGLSFPAGKCWWCLQRVNPSYS